MDSHRDVDNYEFHFNKYSKNKIVLNPQNKQDEGWVVGFVDGEGHFAVNVINNKINYNSKCSRKIKEKYKSYPTFQIRFSVSQHVTSVECLLCKVPYFFFSMWLYLT